MKIRTLESIRKGYHSSSPLLNTAASIHKDTKRLTKSLYFDTVPPTTKQASAATQFFRTYQPHISWVANEWRKQAHSSVPHKNNSDASQSTPPLLTPEIAFLGRSNTGKSSLLNALLDSAHLCRVGSKPGKTTTMHAWTLSSRSKTTPNTKHSGLDTSERLTVLDMPGYGHGSRDEWGNDIVKYLLRRRQLRRAMVLLNPKHGIKEGDEQILRLLRTNGIPYQIVACKCDMLPGTELPERLTQLRMETRRINDSGNQSTGGTLCIDDVLAVGKLGDGKMNKTSNLKTAFGVDEVRWAILQAVGLDEFAIQQLTQAEHKLKGSHPVGRSQNPSATAPVTPQLPEVNRETSRPVLSTQ